MKPEEVDPISESTKLEYQEGSKSCMHYELLRRQGLNFFWAANSAFLYIMFGPYAPLQPILTVFIPFVAVFFCYFTYNNDCRVIGYTHIYMKRLQEIERIHDMNMFKTAKKQLDTRKLSYPNSVFYRIIPVTSCVAWFLYGTFTASQLLIAI